MFPCVQISYLDADILGIQIKKGSDASIKGIKPKGYRPAIKIPIKIPRKIAIFVTQP